MKTNRTKKLFSGHMPVLALILASMALSVACSQDESFGPEDNTGRIPVQFTTGPAEAVSQRTVIVEGGNTTWAGGDFIGIFMLKAGQTLSPTAITGEADNKKYWANPSDSDASQASFNPETDNDRILYPLSGNVDFVAYYPHSTNLTVDYAYKVSLIPQSTGREQAEIDVLYSNNVKNKAKSKTEPAAMEFTHALSRLVINLKKGGDMRDTDFSDASAELTGFPTTADLSLADGEFTNFSGISNNIIPLKWTNAARGYEATFEAILIPQPNGATGREVVFNRNGINYTWTVADNVKLETGKTYTYEITVNEKNIIVSGFTIANWTVSPLREGSGGTNIEAVKIKAGTFQMGASSTDAQAVDNEKPQHWVKLTRDFYMSKNLVTNQEFAEYLNGIPVWGAHVGGNNYVARYHDHTLLKGKGITGGCGLYWEESQKKWKINPGYEDAPVINVTWYGADEYARYVGGSLPTEAQWENACRAGTTTAYSYGNTADGNYMWYKDNSGAVTHQVGLNRPNPWGIYDMHGNVFEWCLDRWDGSNNYPQDANTEADAVVDPLVATGANYVLRGGGWDSDVRSTRSAYRGSADPDETRDNVGFRVVFNQ